MRRIALASLAIIATTGVACHDTPTGPPVVTITRPASATGDMQRDSVYAPLAPFRVLVLANADPAAGVTVYWAISFYGTTTVQTSSTDAAGIAALSLQLPPVAGLYSVQASLVKPPIVSTAGRVTYTVSATAAHPASIHVISGVNQTDVIDARLGADYVIQIIDKYGNGVPGVDVDWTVASGGGAISPAHTVTSAAPDGYTSAHYTLGHAEGTNTVTATAAAVGDGQQATFTSTAIAPLPDGARDLAVEMTIDGNTDVYAMKSDATGLLRLTTAALYDGAPAWSPDGSKIAFVSARTGRTQIWLMNPDGSDQTQVSNNPSYVSGPTWSPDGTKILYVSSTDGGPLNAGIFVVNADGTQQARLTTGTSQDNSPAWSPDGRNIVFVTGRSGRSELYIMGADGSNQKRVVATTADVSSPAWSPDGHTIAFTINTGGYYGLPDIDLVNADGTGLRMLEHSGENPVWSPDGLTVAFSVISICGYYQCNWSLAAINADQSGYRQYTTGDYDRPVSWSPNGQWIAFQSSICSVNSCTQTASLAHRDGTGIRALGGAASLSWKP